MRKIVVLALLLGGLTLAACRHTPPSTSGSGASSGTAAPAPSAPSGGQSCGAGGKA